MMRPFFFLTLLLALAVTQPAVAGIFEHASTVADRQFVNLTIYNGSTALVHDRRRMNLHSGFNRIAWRDVSANMDPTSALLENPGSSNRLDVLEQNFNFDLLNPSALLEKSIGRYVTVVHEARFAGERDTREQARILSTNGGIVLQYKDHIETGVRGYILYPTGSKGFRDRPTLDLDVRSEQEGNQTLDLSYLTGGLNWHVDYVGSMSPDESHLALRGLVTLSNMSGTSYDSAHLQLVAGNVNIAQSQRVPLREIASVTSDSYSVGNVRSENYFEYHLYTVERPTTILDRQTKQMTLLAAADIPIQKTLELRGTSQYYESAQEDLGNRLPLGVYVTFENRGGNLGIPLPAGLVRLYKNDSHGLSQFLGSDAVPHTPRNEPVRLHLGDSFDVIARKRQTSYFQLGCSSDSSYEITIANSKASAQDVIVVESIPGTWQIDGENVHHQKSSASTAKWTLRVPADGHSLLTYTAHTKWC
ncbi:MAG: DUF4139 domain-containing protein [Vulcanimicrobiaceae bacterium]